MSSQAAMQIALPQDISPPAAPLNLHGSIVKNGVIDMRSLMLSLWKHRKDTKYTQALCEELRSLTHTRPILDQVDFYLPQLAHMVLHLENELPMDAMEQFIMLLCLSSTHFALQFFWIVYAALDEHRPKRNGNPRTFTRCAQLLVILEQCLVYGSPVNKQAQELLAQKHISKLEMDLIIKADRRFFAAQSSAAISNIEETAEGWLYKKGGGTSKLGRRSWHRRWCRIERKILFVYNHRMDMHARNAIPLERAQIEIISNPKHPFYFEIHHNYSSTTFKFAASDEDNLASWVESLRVAAAPPAPPATSPSKAGPARAITRMSDGMRQFILNDEKATKENQVSTPAPVQEESNEQLDQSTPKEAVDRSGSVSSTSTTFAPPVLTEEQQHRYDFFTEQINFVKAITDVCEELRLIEASQRRELLPQKLQSLNDKVPEFAYLPLCRSTELFSRISSVCTSDGYVFKTHERAPCLMHFLVEPSNERYDVSSALFAHLHEEAKDQEVDMVCCDSTEESSLRENCSELLLADPARKAKLVEIFGELAEDKRARLMSHDDGRLHLQSLIAKSYDDLRQEVLVMQLITFMDDIFTKENLNLRLRPYRILSTGSSTGLIEVVTNATSFDSLKKSPGFQSLRAYFESIYGDPSSTLFQRAVANFVESLAAYSMVCYVLCIKDRHNGNILLDIEGHVVHIDFGFFLGRAPGGSFSLETAPFKLTAEMVECFGGKDSPNYERFIELCTQAALAIQKHGDILFTLVEVMSYNSKLPCFQSNVSSVLHAFKERLFLTTPQDKVSPLVKSLVEKSYDHFGTTKYDQFQEYSNGIHK